MSKSKRGRSDKECQILIDCIGRKKSGLEKEAYDYVESHFDTDYINSIQHLWLIETYIAGYNFRKSQENARHEEG